MACLLIFYSIIHGLLASTASLLFFLLLGITCLPKKILSACRFPFFWGLVGLSIFCLICFYSLQWDISLYTVFQSLPFFLIPLCIIRRKHLAHCGQILFAPTESYRKWLLRGLVFVLFYLLAFIFLPQPDPRHYLPVTHIANSDIFNYINVAQDLFSLKDSTMAESYLHPFNLPYSDIHWAYYQTPAVYYFHAWMSLFYGGNCMEAAMPVLYMTISLIGLMITYYCYHFFRCPYWMSAGIAAMILCGTFYRFIFGFYFLSSLMGTVIWLAALMSLLQWDFLQRLNRYRALSFILLLSVPLCLLLLFYPIFFWALLPVLLVVILLVLFFERKSFAVKVPYFLYTGLGILAITIVFCITPQAINFSLNNVLCQANRDDILWVLPLLSPLSLLGFPSYYGWLEGKGILVCFVCLCVGLFFCFYQTNKNNRQAPAYILSLLALGSLGAYWLYVDIAGPLRYQPWKFASYFLAPMAGVFWGICFNTLSYYKHYKKIFIALLAICLLGNFFFYYYTLPEAPTNKYRSLSALDIIVKGPLYTKMETFSSTYLARFFIRHHVLHSLNRSYYVKESLTNIADDAPFFVESSHGCEYSTLIPNSVDIRPAGCLYYGIPLLNFGKHYFLKDNLPFIETHGIIEFFVQSADNKRWQGAKASMTFYVNQDILSQHPHGYFHFKVSPFGRQRAFIAWGNHHHKFIHVDSKQWITIRYTLEDWQRPQASKTLKTFTIRFLMPDAKSPHQLNKYDSDMRPRSLDFIQFFMSDNSLPVSANANLIQKVGSGK